MTKPLTIGCHLSTTGGYLAMGKTARELNATTFQFFTRNPRGSAHKIPSPEDVAALVTFMAEHGIESPMAHAPYTYNPCAMDEAIRAYTTSNMTEDLIFLNSIPGALYNFHPGCHVGAGAEAGIKKTADLLRAILPHAGNVRVTIETMAGKGTEIGRSFSEIRQMIDAAGNHPNLGVCLDTCHVHDGGYNISEDVYGVLGELDKIVGFDRLKAIHLNDSKNVLGAHKDRHEKIGDGNLTIDGIVKIITHPVVRHLPICLETPNDIDGYAREIKLLQDAVANIE